MNNKDKQLLDETMMVLSDRLKRLSKLPVRRIKNYDTYDEKGDLEFIIGRDKDKHHLQCWFGYSSKEKSIELTCYHPSDEKLTEWYTFPMEQIKTRINREWMVFWLVSNIFGDEITEKEFEEYFSDKLGFSIPFSKCFTVIRTSDSKPYTGAKGEEPFVGYNSRYMNQLNHGNTLLQGDNLQRVVHEKCKELGFTLKPEQNGIEVLEFEFDGKTKEIKCTSGLDSLPLHLQKGLKEHNDLVNNRILLN